ncbi:Uncharacterized protein TCAP_07265 [Tolypocladium capitatum]|uniref:Uracil permease n=1 Tax=Tolypocladium capitatum TaxID=45235 RepID=A0A2K3Q150_9HYPO|nr:Uncharacterized protein TCAP_07265 [Tolypocladium capitatum]
MKLSSILRRIELEHVSPLVNDDIRPCEARRRTWTSLAFHNFWLLINCNIATFLTGSALVPLGLAWWQAIVSIVIGNILATAALLLSSLPGAYYHIGFSVYSRAVWGIWGSQFTIWNRIFLSFADLDGQYGFQAWVGGQCFYLILLSWDPQYESSIPNTIPTGTGMTSAQFVSYVVFCVISLPFLWIRPHRLQRFFYVASAVTMAFFLALLTWTLATMGPAGFGSTINSAGTIPLTGGSGSTAWLMVYGAMSTVGSIAAGILNQNDYARLATRPRDAILGQAFAYPLYCTFASVLGIIVVAATQNRFAGEAIWNPPTLFVRLLQHDDGAGTRAAVFFSGLALLTSQLGSNIPGNALAGGIDLSSTFPRYINIRRGAYLTALMSPVVNPWRLVDTATVFLTVLSSYGVFLAPMTGLMAANYVVVCRGKIKVDDLYRGDAGGIYWYSYGVNWRAPVAWIVGTVPCLPGFISQVNSSVKVTDGAVQLFYMNYLYGFVASAVVYALLHRVFPATALDGFVRDEISARGLQQHYRDRWDFESSDTPVWSVKAGEAMATAVSV